MEKKYVKIFKCRGCGRDVIKNDVDLSATEQWSLSGQNKFLLHRCDPEKLCICDFIGWKEIEAKND